MEASTPLLLIVLPVLLLAAGVEAWWILRKTGRDYPWQQTKLTLQLALGQRLIGAATAGTVLAVLLAIWNRRPWTFAMDSGAEWLLLFLGVEFFYYWFHRASHVCRWFWATHAVHHTPERMVLSGALRLGWTGPISGGFLFFAPLAWLGFPPHDILLMLAGNLLYQYWLHTEMVPALGVLEGWVNTPSAHRVHHARNPEYLDANYGGVLMVFDRMFGSYIAEDPARPCDYGLVVPVAEDNVLALAFGQWRTLIRDLRSARSMKERLAFAFAAPGWQPDGKGLTTANLRSARAIVRQPNTREKNMVLSNVKLPLAALALAASVLVLAAQPGSDEVRKLLASELPKRFAAADADGNGKLSKAEAMSAMPRVYQHFKEIDTDHDGYVTQADIERAVYAKLLPMLGR